MKDIFVRAGFPNYYQRMFKCTASGFLSLRKGTCGYFESSWRGVWRETSFKKVLSNITSFIAHSYQAVVSADSSTRLQKSRLTYAFLAFSAALVFYTAWGTGLTFRFSEVNAWPNYTMLARAFAEGHTWITEAPLEDFIAFNGKRYLYYGPVPALVRLPFAFAGAAIPTGFMVCLACALCVGAVTLLLSSVLGEEGNAVTIGLVIFFAVNGLSLFMTAVPSIHHEAIAWAMFFLLVGLNLLRDMSEDEHPLGPARSAALALVLSLSVGSRVSYVFSAVFVAIAFLWRLWRTREADPRRAALSLGAFLLPAAVFAAMLLGYNYLRFGAILDFGITRQVSLFEHALFLDYRHIPYHLWSIFAGPPVWSDVFPYMTLPNYKLVIQSVGVPQFRFTYTNELSVSIFLLAPITLAAFAPLFGVRYRSTKPTHAFGFAAGLAALQLLSISLGILTAPRFYYDFLPILLVMTACGLMGMSLRTRAVLLPTGVALSVMLSALLLLGSLPGHLAEIEYVSPLLRWLR